MATGCFTCIYWHIGCTKANQIYPHQSLVADQGVSNNFSNFQLAQPNQNLIFLNNVQGVPVKSAKL